MCSNEQVGTMENSFREIQCLAQDLRLNPLNSEEIKEYKLKMIEDICIKSIFIINEIRNENN